MLEILKRVTVTIFLLYYRMTVKQGGPFLVIRKGKDRDEKGTGR